MATGDATFNPRSAQELAQFITRIYVLMAVSTTSFSGIAGNMSKPVSITVLEGRDLKGTKGDSPVTFIRAEFNSIALGDSPKVDISPEGSVKYNFTVTFDCTPEGQFSLDDVAHKPFIFTVIEVLPKEKKQKDEKTVTLGQAVLDLWPLLQGSSEFHTTLPLYPLPGSPLETLRPDAKCGIDVLVSVQESLLSPKQLNDGNLLRVTVEAAYSVPEAFVPTGPLQNYLVGFQVPAVGEKECPFLFRNGVLKLGGEKEPLPRPKKWPVVNILAPGGQNIPDSFIVGGPYEEENGELNTEEERETRIMGETIKKRIVWDVERRCYLDPVAVHCLRKRIADCRCWPVEITRIPVATSPKGKAGKGEKGGGGAGGTSGTGGDDEQIFFHGVAFVNLVPLLYPGVKRIHGAFRVFAYHDSEVFEKLAMKRPTRYDDGAISCGTYEMRHAGFNTGTAMDCRSLEDIIKTKCLYSLLRDVGFQAALNKTGPIGVYTPHTKGIIGKNVREEKPTKDTMLRKVSTVMRRETSETTLEGPMSAFQNIEGQQYVESGTFVVIEFVLDRPLVPKRLPEELAKRVKEMIPPRPQLPRRTAGAKKAVEDYHSQIISIAGSILDEYHELFGSQLAEGMTIDSHTLEDQKCQLNYELNSSGKYFAFKEQLKHAVVKIVREKYLRTTPFDNLDQLQAFLSELYVYLADQMHVALNQVLSHERQSPPPPTFTTSEQLRLFALEAQINEDYSLATTYHQEVTTEAVGTDLRRNPGFYCLHFLLEMGRSRLARDHQDIDSWLDYGAFCLLTDDTLKAQECFREGLALDSQHLHSLLLCGITAVMLQNYEEAEVFFEEATCLQPSSVLAWTILGLFYEIQENDIRVEMAFQEATKHQKAHLAKEKPPPVSADGGGLSSRVPSIIIPTEQAVSEDVPEGFPKSQTDSLEPSLTLTVPEEETVSKSSKRLSVVISKSKLSTQKEGTKSPAIPLGTEASRSSQPSVTIFMESVSFLMQVNALQFVHRALAHELVCPQGGPSCDYFLMLAKSYLLRKKYNMTEECLEMAIQIDYLNPDVWAQKGHLYYLTGNFSEAKACYERTISFVTDAKDMHFVYLRLGSIYLKEKEYEKAKNIYLLASKRSPSCLTWLGVGIACYRLKEMAEAEDALSEANALNNNNAEVWAYLALVCMQGGRQLEAEQSYKYAVKLKLVNEDLLQEIKELQQTVGFGDPSF